MPWVRCFLPKPTSYPTRLVGCHVQLNLKSTKGNLPLSWLGNLHLSWLGNFHLGVVATKQLAPKPTCYQYRTQVDSKLAWVQPSNAPKATSYLRLGCVAWYKLPLVCCLVATCTKQLIPSNALKPTSPKGSWYISHLRQHPSQLACGIDSKYHPSCYQLALGTTQVALNALLGTSCLGCVAL